jgi:hypothetical protein
MAAFVVGTAMPGAITHGGEKPGLDAQPVKTIDAVNATHDGTSRSDGWAATVAGQSPPVDLAITRHAGRPGSLDLDEAARLPADFRPLLALGEQVVDGRCQEPRIPGTERGSRSRRGGSARGGRRRRKRPASAPAPSPRAASAASPARSAGSAGAGRRGRRSVHSNVARPHADPTGEDDALRDAGRCRLRPQVAFLRPATDQQHDAVADGGAAAGGPPRAAGRDLHSRRTNQRNRRPSRRRVPATAARRNPVGVN